MWWIAEWWRDGQKLGRGVAMRIVTAPDWKRPTYNTCRTALSVASRFPPECRHLHNLEFCHYQAVRSLPDETAWPLLHRASAERWSVDKLRQERRRRVNGYYAKTEGDIFQTLAAVVASGKKFRCVVADVPWWSDDACRRGGAAYHYPSMTSESLQDLGQMINQMTTPDCVLFLWVPQALVFDAKPIIDAWGFGYKTGAVWLKDEFKTGWYFRMQHELLLFATRPGSPPFIARDISSIINGDSVRHSEKPEVVYELIERAVAGPYLELFARQRRDGWDQVGDQLT
jgi:N6-adenosine-specific RNA methylase IME4